MSLFAVYSIILLALTSIAQEGHPTGIKLIKVLKNADHHTLNQFQFVLHVRKIISFIDPVAAKLGTHVAFVDIANFFTSKNIDDFVRSFEHIEAIASRLGRASFVSAEAHIRAMTFTLSILDDAARIYLLKQYDDDQQFVLAARRAEIALNPQLAKIKKDDHHRATKEEENESK